MKICDVTQFYSPVSGGVKRYVQEKIAFIRRRSANGEAPANRHLLIVPGANDEVTRDEHSTIYTIKSPLISRRSQYRALLRLNEIRRILELEKPDIIESGDPYQVGWRVTKFGRELGIPVVGFYHSHFPEEYERAFLKWWGKSISIGSKNLAQRYARRLYNRHAITLAPSPALADELHSWGVRNVANVDLGVDATIFSPSPDDRAPTRKALGIPPDRILLLSVGRLAKEKNTKVLTKAFSRLAKREPERFHLLIIGDGTQRPLVKRLGEKFDCVTWRAYCADPTDLARLYRAADLLVHAGIQETFGLVTIEAQACGTPVVGIAGSRMDRLVFSDQMYWARENSADALAEAISLTANRDLRAMGREAASAVASRFSWDVVFARQFEIYQTVLRSF